MSWNWLDVVVILLGLGQVGVIVAIVMIALRIKNGPVARVTWLVQRSVRTGTRFAQTGKKIGLASLPPAMRIRASVVELTKSFHVVKFTDAPITYASFKKPLVLLGALETTIATAKAAVKADAKTKRSIRPRSFADRMGLIPPAWVKIAPLLGYAGTALTVWREVEKQLPEIRSRLLSARDTD